MSDFDDSNFLLQDIVEAEFEIELDSRMSRVLNVWGTARKVHLR